MAIKFDTRHESQLVCWVYVWSKAVLFTDSHFLLIENFIVSDNTFVK